MRALRRHQLPSGVAYAASTIYERALSFISIPATAYFLAPSEYGQLDITASVLEFFVLVAIFGLPPTLIRFASTAKTEDEAKRNAAEFMGGALTIAAAVIVISQAFVPTIIDALHISLSETAVRWALLGTAMVALIEVPLQWIRLKDRATTYFYLVVIRTTAQVFFLISVLAAGYGAEGMLVSNACILVLAAAIMSFIQWRETGIIFTGTAAMRLLWYASPLLGAALAQFALGASSRWFLAGEVTDAEIAHYGLGSRLALMTALVITPFLLWWNPQRIAALQQPGGLERSVRIIALGFGILLFGVLGVALTGPVFIVMLLPEAYLPAAQYVAPMAAAIGLHNLTQLVDVGCYARANGLRVLAIDAAGAALAITGFIVLIPMFGVWGAVYAILGGHMFRLAAFFIVGHALAPLKWPWSRAVIAVAAALALELLAPSPTNQIASIIWCLIAMPALAALLLQLRLVTLPDGWVDLAMARVRDVRQR